MFVLEVWGRYVTGETIKKLKSLKLVWEPGPIISSPHQHNVDTPRSFLLSVSDKYHLDELTFKGIWQKLFTNNWGGATHIWKKKMHHYLPVQLNSSIRLSAVYISLSHAELQYAEGDLEGFASLL